MGDTVSDESSSGWLEVLVQVSFVMDLSPKTTWPKLIFCWLLASSISGPEK